MVDFGSRFAFAILMLGLAGLAVLAIVIVTRPAAVRGCEAALQQRMAHPSTVRFDLLQFGKVKSYGENWFIERSFTARNAIGVEFAFDGYCSIVGGRMEAVVLEQGSY
jgi:hypothetical protein